MDSTHLLDAIGAINDDVIRDAKEYIATSNTRPRFRHRLSAAMIAAILTLFLMGAGVVAVIFGDSIQSWFGHYWEIITGQSMSEEQTALIDNLSQDIGMSQTVDDVTITVDSATIGYDNFFLLLKVEGVQHAAKNGYGFGEIMIEVTPDPAQDTDGLGGYGIVHCDLDGDGAVLLLIEYSYASGLNNERNTQPLNISLTLTDFLQNAHTNDEKLLTEGEWCFDFSLDRSKGIQVIQLPDTEIMALDSNKNELVAVTINNIKLTATGLNFQYDYKQGTLSIEDCIEVLLDNGKTVRESGGGGVVMEDGKTLNCTHQWQLPINLDEISAVKIGKAVISIP